MLHAFIDVWAFTWSLASTVSTHGVCTCESAAPICVCSWGNSEWWPYWVHITLSDGVLLLVLRERERSRIRGSEGEGVKERERESRKRKAGINGADETDVLRRSIIGDEGSDRGRSMWEVRQRRLLLLQRKMIRFLSGGCVHTLPHFCLLIGSGGSCEVLKWSQQQVVTVFIS